MQKGTIGFLVLGMLSIALASCDGSEPTGAEADTTAPAASIVLLTGPVASGGEVAFSVMGSDASGLVSRTLVLGDGTELSASLGGALSDTETLTHVYTESGVRTARVEYTDAAGNLGEGSVTFTVAELPLPDGATWTLGGDLPFPVRYAAAASSLGDLYVFGGTNPAGTQTGFTQILDVATGTWTAGASMPEPSDYVAAATGPGGIHVVGGSRSGPLDAHRLYDPATNNWTTLPALPKALNGAAAEVVGGRLYVFGGVSGGRNYLDDVYIFDIGSSTWSSGAAIPGPRISAVSAVLNGRIHLIGGGVPTLSTTAEHLVYDPATDSWSAGPALPVARETLGAGVLEGWLCVFGGRVAASGRFNTPQSDAFCLRPDGSEWVSVQSLAQPRAEIASTVVGGQIYALGGHDGTDTPRGTVQRFGR